MIDRLEITLPPYGCAGSAAEMAVAAKVSDGCKEFARRWSVCTTDERGVKREFVVTVKITALIEASEVS